MTDILSETAYAKINLALHVRWRRGDGFHCLETLFAFVDSGDGLTAEEAEELTLSVSGPFGADLDCGVNNLIIRAANALREHFCVHPGAKLVLEKNLPVSSGIGGGSADAAAAARLLNKLWKLAASDAELASLLAPLGADIPACIASRTAIGTGTGTDLQTVQATELTGMPVLLVNPLQPVATAEVFGRWDGIDRGALQADHLLTAMHCSRNDLEMAAISLCPAIAEILVALNKTDRIVARMSGSGATCFALYNSTRARDLALAEMPSRWWTLTGNLR